MKTAGTSIVRLMEDQYGSEYTNALPTHEGTDESLFLKKAKSNHPLIISGHPDHLFHLWETVHCRTLPRFTMTFFRNPIDRYISCYYFLSRSKFVNTHVASYNLSFEEAIKSNNPKFSDNIITKALASLGSYRDYTTPATPDDFKHAIENLKKMNFIGIVEEFNISCALLAHMLNMKLPTLTKWNVNEKYPSKHDLDRKLVQRVQMKNIYDLQLFDIALQIFDVQRAQTGIDTTTLLANMKESQTVYIVKQHEDH